MRVVVTGAASGIGKAVAQMLGAKGAEMLLVDRDHQGLEAVQADIGARVAIINVDLLDPGCGDKIAAAAEECMGGCTALVSNAGAISNVTLDELSVEAFDRTFTLNTRATWLLARALRPAMIRAGGGSIVATASMSAHHATPPLGAYAPSKAALWMIVRQLANQWGPDGIRVNSVSPGPTLTGMTEAGYADAERRALRESMIPLRRLNEASDVAAAICFLLSDEARQISGIDILVDGGLSTTLMTASGSGSGQGQKQE